MSRERKIAIFGPPLAGKSTLLLAFAQSRAVTTQMQRIRGRMATNFEHLKFLRQVRLAVRGCFVISKSDLLTSLPVPKVRQLLDLDIEALSGWPTYETTIRKPDTLLASFDFLLADG
jgi:signal recognition particle receptor subunit beta